VEPGACAWGCRVSSGLTSCLLQFLQCDSHYGCCLGDTLASELGILSQGKPRLITTLRPVPPGTNGGMTVGGTLASLVGGALAGVLMAVTLLLENERCRDTWSSVLLSIISWGAFSGLFGSLVSWEASSDSSATDYPLSSTLSSVLRYNRQGSRRRERWYCRMRPRRTVLSQ